jgi:RNA recognition motif-containing protein
MLFDIYVNDAKIEQAIRIRNISKINLSINVDVDDLFDFVEQFGKLKQTDFDNLKEFINALEKNNG